MLGIYRTFYRAIHKMLGIVAPCKSSAEVGLKLEFFNGDFKSV